MEMLALVLSLTFHTGSDGTEDLVVTAFRFNIRVKAAERGNRVNRHSHNYK